MTTTTKKAKSKTIQIVWDEFKTIEHHASYLLQEGEAATEKEAFDMACCDSDFIGLEYDDFIAEFSAILKKISAKGRYHVEGRNIGWRFLSGTLELEAINAEAFIHRAFPKTSEWRLEGQYDPAAKTLTYQLYHHDAPTGESYTVTRQ